jgi:glycosyltransferase involved in cell wall biosynthesis
VRRLTEAHLVIAGPDDGHGTSALVQEAEEEPVTGGRIHTLPVSEQPPYDLYPEADVFVLPSAGESFGIVAAEAAAAGTPVVATDRCGIADFFRDGEALVVPYERDAIIEAVRTILADHELRERLARGGVAAARRMSWDRVTDVQEEIYREAVASRTAARKLSIDES